MHATRLACMHTTRWYVHRCAPFVVNTPRKSWQTFTKLQGKVDQTLPLLWRGWPARLEKDCSTAVETVGKNTIIIVHCQPPGITRANTELAKIKVHISTWWPSWEAHNLQQCTAIGYMSRPKSRQDTGKIELLAKKRSNLYMGTKFNILAIYHIWLFNASGKAKRGLGMRLHGLASLSCVQIQGFGRFLPFQTEKCEP